MKLCNLNFGVNERTSLDLKEKESNCCLWYGSINFNLHIEKHALKYDTRTNSLAILTITSSGEATSIASHGGRHTWPAQVNSDCWLLRQGAKPWSLFIRLDLEEEDNHSFWAFMHLGQHPHKCSAKWIHRTDMHWALKFFQVVCHAISIYLSTP